MPQKRKSATSSSKNQKGPLLSDENTLRRIPCPYQNMGVIILKQNNFASCVLYILLYSISSGSTLKSAVTFGTRNEFLLQSIMKRTRQAKIERYYETESRGHKICTWEFSSNRDRSYCFMAKIS